LAKKSETILAFAEAIVPNLVPVQTPLLAVMILQKGGIADREAAVHR